MKIILVVCSDAGGTYALVPVIRELLSMAFIINIIASRPAIEILENASLSIKCNIEDDDLSEQKAEQVLKKFHPDVLISGAGAYNLIEHTFRRASKQMGVYCIALIDGWFNFKNRFERYIAGELISSVPDKIAVMNESSIIEMKNEGFDHEKLEIVGAPHIEDTVNFVLSASQKYIEAFQKELNLPNKSIVVIYFSAPVSQRNRGYSNISILHDVTRCLSELSLKNNQVIQLLVKNHPSESVSLLRSVLEPFRADNKFYFQIVDRYLTKELLCIGDIAIGMTSTALMEATCCGLPALSVQIGRNLTCDPDRYFSNQDGITAIYDYEKLENTVSGNFFKKQKKLKIDPSNSATKKFIELILKAIS
jgi:hypothetical protein